MKKIGILLESIYCSQYFYETVGELAKSNQIDLFFLLNSPASEHVGVVGKTKSFSIDKLLQFIKWIPFRVLSAVEFNILAVFSQEVREHEKSMRIDRFTKNEFIYLNPIFSPSKLIVRYPEKNIEKITSLELDFIIRGNAPGIFKGDIINSAKEGIISFHHGDNRWNRGGPPGFWEVYFRKPSTGFILQTLTEELDGGSVLLRGSIPTDRFYTKNIINLCKFSYPYLSKLVLQYASNNKLPSVEESLPFDGPLLVAPSFTQSISYLSRTLLSVIKRRIEKHVLRTYLPRWNVCFIRSPWRSAILRKGVRIKNPPNHYFADPFVVTREGKTVCYVEDYDYIKKKGGITAIELVGRKNYSILGPVIEEDFHLSFPFLFEYKEDLYMVPESSEAGSIRLYKCVQFPLVWKYQKDLLSGIKAVDSIIFFHEGRWWLLCNKIEHEINASILMAFYSDSPLSDEWTPHECNPLVVDSDISRNGGLLDMDSSFPVRVRQKHDFAVYGKALTLAAIKKLSPSSFKEEKIGEVSPDFFKKIHGVHHMHSKGDYTVYDYSILESPH